MIAALVSSCCFEPLDYARTRMSLGASIGRNRLRGLRLGILSSICSNTLGHTLLETFGARA